MITIKDLFEHWDVTRQDVCKRLSIPYRTLQNWLNGTRKCPDYVVLLLDEWMSKHCLPREITWKYIEKLEHELTYGGALLKELQSAYYDNDNALDFISDEDLAELLKIEDLN